MRQVRASIKLNAGLLCAVIARHAMDVVLRHAMDVVLRHAVGVVLVLIPILSARAEAQPSTKLSDRIRITKRSVFGKPLDGDNPAYLAEKRSVLEAKRRLLIAEIRNFLANASDERQKAELELRLGGLYMEEYTARLADAQDRYAKAYAAYQAAPKRPRSAPVLDTSRAQAFLKKAAALYRGLIRRYPDHPRRQEIYYALAISSVDKGRTEEAVTYFKQVPGAGKNARLTNQAYVQLGDYYFERNQFSIAERYYDKVLAEKVGPLFSYASFKKAWCAYHTSRSPLALMLLKGAVEYESKSGQAPSVPVKSEALRDLALVFVDLKQVDEAISFYRDYGDEALKGGMETMADLYFEKADYQRAVSVWEKLLDRFPSSKKAPAYELGIVRGLDLFGGQGDAVKRLVDILPRYLGDSKWRDENRKDSSAQKDAERSLEEATRKLALELHASAQKQKDEVKYGEAKTLYEEYLKSFPASPEAPTLEYNLAEIYYHDRNYAQASDRYYALYRGTTAGPLREEALRGALVSIDSSLNEEHNRRGLASKAKAPDGAPLRDKVEDLKARQTDYSKDEKRFLEVSGEFVKHFPSDKQVPDILYERAYLEYLHHDFDSSTHGFNDLVQRYAGTPASYSAAYLLLDILNRGGDLAKLVTTSKQLLSRRELARADFRAEISDVLRKGELKKAQLAEEASRFKEAADAYVGYAKSHGGEDKALLEKALYNAAIDYDKAGLPTLALRVDEDFLLRCPASELLREVLSRAASRGAKLSRFSEAAALYEKLVRAFPKSADAPHALRLAALYRWGNHDLDGAERLMLELMEKSPEEQATVEKDLLALYASERNGEARLLHYYERERQRRGAKDARALYVLVKAAALEAKLAPRLYQKTVDEALRLARSRGKKIAEDPRGAEALSELYFHENERREASFEAIRLSVGSKDPAATLQRKLKLLKELDGEYQRIARYGSAQWGLGSLFRTAALYREMAADVAGAAVPKGLDAKALESYREEITKRAVAPLTEKALELSKKCLNQAADLSILSTWTTKCLLLANDLDPVSFPAARTLYVPPLQTALWLPEKDSGSRTPVGHLDSGPFPFLAPPRFDRPTRQVSSLGARNLMPVPVDYSALSRERLGSLKKSLGGAEKGSLAYLSVESVVDPRAAVTQLLRAIENDFSSPYLHNLLGMAFLETGDLPAAAVTWLTLIAEGSNEAAVWNNLGVVHELLGREEAAQEDFTRAAKPEKLAEAESNLGSLALKYRNGEEAKKHFARSLDLKSTDPLAAAGLAVALAQKGNLSEAREKLEAVVKKFPDDPYATQSLESLSHDFGSNEKESTAITVR